jgi:uncharacterized membrane protein YfcA
VELIAYVALGTAAGLLIGCVGIGGVILVPALVYLAGQSVPAAIAAALAAFMVSGVVGIYSYARQGSIDWRATAWSWLGALPCAFAGALLVNAVAPAALELLIAALAAGSGIHALLGRRERKPSREAPLPRASMTAVGGATGLLSALTGTGGPLVLVPILLSLEVPLLAALGLAQAIQLPIAVAATAGNALSSALDIPLASALAAGIAIGTWVGAKAAHALPTEPLRKAVAVLLVLVGALMALRLATL